MLSKRNFIIVLFGLSSLVFAAVSPVVLLDQTAIRLIKQLKQHHRSCTLNTTLCFEKLLTQSLV